MRNAKTIFLYYFYRIYLLPRIGTNELKVKTNVKNQVIITY